jgi:6-phosphofructokinase 1
MVGEMAVKQAVQGESDIMITLLRQASDDGTYAAITGTTPLVNIANAERHMPPEFLNAAGNFVTQAFVEYARPLIGGDLPHYFRFDREAIL